jgi:TetR/AcrR family transcriptional regulator, mexJK operon transcriptional repressor
MGTNMEKAPVGKREQRKAERREAILEIAQQSFLDNGYDRTTMSSIAEAMGGSKGTLWSYFDSKEALFGAMIDRAGAAFRADLVAALDPLGQPAAGLRRFAETFLRKITRPDAVALQRMIVGECPHFPELGSIFYERAPGATRELLSGYILARMNAGALRRDDPMKAANMLLSLCTGGHHQRVMWGVESFDERTIDDEVAVAIELFLRAFGPLPDADKA